MRTYLHLHPSEDGVIKEPVTIKTVEVYSPADPERVIKIIGNGNVTEDETRNW